MQMETVGSDTVRTSWGATVDKALGGTEVVVERYNRPVVSVVNHEWLQRLKKMAGVYELHLAVAKERLHAMVTDPEAHSASEEELYKVLDG